MSREEGHDRTHREEVRMKSDTEIGVMLSQAQEYPRKEARKDSSLKISQGGWPR